MIRGAMFIAGLIAVGISPAAAAPRSFVVTIDKMKFGALPANARRGDTIVWVNQDLFRHTATAKNRSFDVDLAPGARAKTVLKAAGTTSVVCKYHPGMRAVLKVNSR